MDERRYTADAINELTRVLGVEWTIVPPAETAMRCPFEPACDYHQVQALVPGGPPCAWADPRSVPRRPPRLHLIAIVWLALAAVATAPACMTDHSELLGRERSEAGRDVDQVDAIDVDQVDAIDVDQVDDLAISCGLAVDPRSCSSCRTDTTSLDLHCRSMLACVVAAWPCDPGSGCWLVCDAAEGGSQQTSVCVAAIVAAETSCK
jgi:hypothetical protein